MEIGKYIVLFFIFVGFISFLIINDNTSVKTHYTTMYRITIVNNGIYEHYYTYEYTLKDCCISFVDQHNNKRYECNEFIIDKRD